MTEAPWSWVHEPEASRPVSKGVGRYTRPLAGRDQVVMTAFGAEVRKLRGEREFSTRHLAVILGMSQPAITQIETGRRANIDFRLVWDFAEALGVSAAHLVAVCERAVAVEELKRFTRKGRAK
ncbi:helix-turn-helix domain-containing protein [Paraburkholderia kururiensis]|uniref:helix-turn-helix domain-containing protein n=1 Tax=Paraburkholderia kururiensis TaxID=984307 RepID=UPI000F875202|nr:helix-turn-helix transcriptional regulator [Paraburkholderia kururiensis]